MDVPSTAIWEESMCSSATGPMHSPTVFLLQIYMELNGLVVYLEIGAIVEGRPSLAAPPRRTKEVLHVCVIMYHGNLEKKQMLGV